MTTPDQSLVRVMKYYNTPGLPLWSREWVLWLGAPSELQNYRRIPKERGQGGISTRSLGNHIEQSLLAVIGYASQHLLNICYIKGVILNIGNALFYIHSNHAKQIFLSPINIRKLRLTNFNCSRSYNQSLGRTSLNIIHICPPCYS